MAKQLNKKLVIGLTIAGMVITAVAGMVMVATLPEKDPRYYVNQAREASKQGEHLKASRLYFRAWKVSSDAGYLVDCGQELLDSGDVGAARKEWADAIAANPKLESAHQKMVELNLEIAQLARSVGAWEEVRSAASRLVGADDDAKNAPPPINSKNAMGLYARGLARLNLTSLKKNYEELGEKDLIEAHRLAPEEPRYGQGLADHYAERARRSQSNAQTSEAEAQRLEELGQREAALAKRNDAAASRKDAAENWDRAERILRSVVDAAEKNAAAAHASATTTQPASDTSAEKAAEAHRNHGVFLMSRAASGDASTAESRQRQRTRLTESLAELEKAVSLAPDATENYLALGQYWAGLDALERRLTGATSRPTTTTRIRDDYFKKAEAALSKAIEVGPDEYTNYLTLGTLYSSMGEPKRALAVYDQRLDRTMVRASALRWQYRQHKLMLLHQAFQTALQQHTGQAEDKKLNDDLLAKAEGYYRKVVAEAPAGENDPFALIMKGRLDAVRGKYLDAIPTLELAAKQLPPNAPGLADVRYLLGDLYMRTGNSGEAVNVLRDVVAQYPNSDEAQARLAGALYVNTETRGQAIRVAEQALRLNPDNRAALTVMLDAYTRDRNWDKVRDIQKRLQAGEPEGSETVLLARARQAILEAYQLTPPDAEKLESAKRDLRQLVDKDPTNLKAVGPLAQILASEKKTAELNDLMNKALAAARASQKKDRKNLEQDIQLLSVSLSPGKTREEITKAQEELIRKGEYEDEYSRERDFLQFYVQTNDMKQAFEHAKKAHELRPDDTSLLDTLFRLAVMSKDDALVRQVMKQAADANLDGAKGRFYTGRYALATNDFERAAQEFRAGLDISGTNSNGQAMLGQALMAARHYDEAQKAFAEAVKINPNNVIAVLGLARLGEMRNQPELLDQYFARAKELAPNDPWVQQKVQEEQEAKDPEKAIVARENIRKTMPSDPQKVEPAHIGNLLRLAALYERLTPPRHDEAEAALKEAFEKTQANETLQNRAVPWAYASFLRDRQDKPEPERGLEILKTYVQSVKDKDEKAAAQLLVAQHLQECARRGLKLADSGSKAESRPAQPPSLADIDAAYGAAVNISDSFEVLMGTANWYRQTQRIPRAEEYYRKAIAKAAAGSGAASREQERMARRYLVDTLIQARDVERRADVDALVADYIKRFPDDPMGFLFQGLADINAGREKEAVDALSRYIAKDPNSALAYYRRGYLYFHQEKWDAALEDLQKAKTLSPSDFGYEHRMLLADTLLRKGQPEAAVNEIEGILREDPGANAVARQLVALYSNLQRIDQAEAKALVFRNQFPQDPFWPFRLGQLSEERARRTSDPARKGEYYRTATQYYRSAIEISKFSSDAVSALLRCLLSADRYDDVIDYVTKTLPADKKSPDHSMLLAGAYAKKGQLDLASRECDRALAAAKTNPVAMLLAVENVRRIFGTESALKAARARATANPGDWIPPLMVGVFREQSADEAEKQKRPEDAKTARADADKAFQDALAVAKDKQARLVVLRTFAQYLYVQKRLEECAKLYTQVLEITPDDLLTLNNLAYMLMTDLGRPKESIEYAKRAANLARSNANVLDTYGWNLALLGEYADALGPLGAAVFADPDNTLARYHRAFTYKKLAETKQGNAEEMTRLAKADAQRAYDAAVKKGETENIKLFGDFLRQLGITPTAPPTTMTAG
jgi:tetratricopeptide (TPR) repeat protein